MVPSAGLEPALPNGQGFSLPPLLSQPLFKKCLQSGLYLHLYGATCLVSTPSRNFSGLARYQQLSLHRIYVVLLSEFPLKHSNFSIQVLCVYQFHHEGISLYISVYAKIVKYSTKKNYTLPYLKLFCNSGPCTV